MSHNRLEEDQELESLRLAEELTGLSNPFPHGFPGRQKEFEARKLSNDLFFYIALTLIAEGIQETRRALPQCRSFSPCLILSHIPLLADGNHPSFIKRILSCSSARIERTESDEFIVTCQAKCG